MPTEPSPGTQRACSCRDSGRGRLRVASTGLSLTHSPSSVALCPQPYRLCVIRHSESDDWLIYCQRFLLKNPHLKNPYIKFTGYISHLILIYNRIWNLVPLIHCTCICLCVKYKYAKHHVHNTSCLHSGVVPGVNMLNILFTTKSETERQEKKNSGHKYTRSLCLILRFPILQ